MNNLIPIVPDSKLIFKPDVANSFFKAFNYKLITLQLLTKTNEENPLIPGKTLWNKTKGSSAVTYSADKNLQDQPFLPDMFSLQHQGLGCFFMVNEGDGITHPPAFTPRSAQSVTTLKSVFVDTDLGDIKILGNYLVYKHLVPHFVVESSPTKFHVYLLIEPTPATPENLSKWKRIQEFLFNLDKRYDHSMADPAKLLRIPGFYHTKNIPFLTHIVQDNTVLGDLPAYTLDHLYKTLDIKEPTIIQLKSSNELGTVNATVISPSIVNGVVQNGMPLNGSTSYRFPAVGQKIEEGSRHQELVSFVRHASNHTTNRDDLINSALGHAMRFFKDYQPFIVGNVRHAELLKIVDDVIHYQRAEEERKALQLLAEDQLPTLDQVNAESHAAPNDSNVLMSPEDIFDTFQLPDSFYLNAPGIAGSIIREICASAMHPAPAITFASAICALGTLKAKLVMTETHCYPSNYFFCFAPTGSGKAHAQHVISSTFKSLGIIKLLSNAMPSANGIIRFLDENNGIGFYLLDEIEVFLKSLDSEYSPPYIRQIRDILLQLYTATNGVFHSGYTGDKRLKPVVLDNPVLNIAGHGVPQTLVDCFNVKSIASGFLQRFIVLTQKTSSNTNENCTGATTLSTDLRAELKEMVLKAHLTTEEDLIEELEIEQDVEAINKDTTVSDDVKKQLKTKLNKFKAEKPQPSRVVLRFSPNAKKAYNAFESDMFKLRRREEDSFSGLSGLYTRAAEQVGRLCAAMASPAADALIEESLVEYGVTLMRSRVEAMRAFCALQYESSANSASGVSLKDDMVNLVRHCKRYLVREPLEKYISYRKIMQTFKVRDSRRLKEVLEACLETGLLVEISVEKKMPGPLGRYFIIPK